MAIYILPKAKTFDLMLNNVVIESYSNYLDAKADRDLIIKRKENHESFEDILNDEIAKLVAEA